MTLTPHASMRNTLCCTAVVAAVFAGTIQAQDTARGGTPPASPQAQAQTAGRGQMGTMMAERQKMMAEMTAAQKKLDDLVATMNGATGQAKVDQMAAIITELVAERKAMQSRMLSMQGGMMKQMMQPAPPAPPAGVPPATPPPAGHEHQ